MAAQRRSGRSWPGKQLDKSDRIVCILDRDLRVVYANAACCQWLGVDEQTLSGALLTDPRLAGPSSGLAELLIPPAHLATGCSRVAAIDAQQKSDAASHVRPRLLRFMPLGESSDPAHLVLAVETCEADRYPTLPQLDDAALQDHVAALRRRIPALDQLFPLIGDAVAMQRARQRAAVASGTWASCLLRGAPGSGGRPIARSIHNASVAKDHPLIPIEASLMDAELLDASLAGGLAHLHDEPHNRIALLLGEIDEMPSDAQVALLAVLNDYPEQVRCFSTARTDLTEIAGDGFLPELAYRLTSLVIEIPDLSDRPADIPLLASYLLANRQSKPARIQGFSREALETLIRYPWPGDLSELEATIRHAITRCSAGSIEQAHLPLAVRTYESASPAEDEETMDLDRFLSEVEQELILRALRRAKGNRASAARSLSISRARLLRRIEDADEQATEE